jgi:hypothetical protein
MLSNFEVQTYLKIAGVYDGSIDGIIGPKSLEAMRDLYEDFMINHDLPPLDRGASLRVATEQIIMSLASPSLYKTEDVDGWVGPDTRYSWTLWEASTWRNTLMSPAINLKSTPLAANVWPRQTELAVVLGMAGTGQVMLELPFPMRLAWNTNQIIGRFSIHSTVHDSAMRAFNAILEHYGPEQIEDLRLDLFGGCLNVRPMRGGTMPSTHSWGVAIDFDPEHNQLRWGKRQSTLAQDVYKPFWEIWEAEGWVSLGRTRDFDWMHVQAARI